MKKHKKSVLFMGIAVAVVVIVILFVKKYNTPIVREGCFAVYDIGDAGAEEHLLTYELTLKHMTRKERNNVYPKKYGRWGISGTIQIDEEEYVPYYYRLREKTMGEYKMYCFDFYAKSDETKLPTQRKVKGYVSAAKDFSLIIIEMVDGTEYYVGPAGSIEDAKDIYEHWISEGYMK